MPLEVAAHANPLLHDEEGVGLHLAHLLLQGLDLVLAQAHAQHLQGLIRVGAVALPVGHAPPQPLHDKLGQLRLLLPGEDQHLDGDALLVGPVQKQAVKDRVNGRIDGGGGIKEHQAEGVKHGVAGDAELAHGEALALLAHVQAQDVKSAAAAPAGQHDAPGKAVDHAPQEAAGEGVLHNGVGRHRYHGQKQGAAYRAGHRPHHKAPAHGFPRQYKQRYIQQQVQNAGDVEARVQAQPLGHNGAKQLAEAQQTAGV